MPNSVLSAEHCKLFGKAFLKIKLAKSEERVSIADTLGARRAFEQKYGVALIVVDDETNNDGNLAGVSEDLFVQRQPLAAIMSNGKVSIQQQRLQNDCQMPKSATLSNNNRKRTREVSEGVAHIPTGSKYFKTQHGRVSAPIVHHTPQGLKGARLLTCTRHGYSDVYKAIGITPIDSSTSLLPSPVILKAPGLGLRQEPSPITLFWKGQTAIFKPIPTPQKLRSMVVPDGFIGTSQGSAGCRSKIQPSDGLPKPVRDTAGQKHKRAATDGDAIEQKRQKRAPVDDRELASTMTRMPPENPIQHNCNHEIDFDSTSPDTFTEISGVNGIKTERLEETVIPNTAAPIAPGRKREQAESAIEEDREPSQKRTRISGGSICSSNVLKQPEELIQDDTTHQALMVVAAPLIQARDPEYQPVEETVVLTVDPASQTTAEQTLTGHTGRFGPFYAVEDLESFPYPTYHTIAAFPEPHEQELDLNKVNGDPVGQVDPLLCSFIPEHILNAMSGVEILNIFSLEQIRATCTDEQLEAKGILWAVQDNQIE